MSEDRTGDSPADLAERAARYRKDDPAFARWAAGYGPIRHDPATQVKVRALVDALAYLGERQERAVASGPEHGGGDAG
jgi:hypothetical protein